MVRFRGMFGWCWIRRDTGKNCNIVSRLYPLVVANLLIAGATVSMLYWDADFCQQLSEKGFFVIRYDNRDVGKSTHYEPGSTPYDIVDLTNDAILILDGYKI